MKSLFSFVPLLIALVVSGCAACKDIGVLLDVYNKAAVGAAKIKAASDLNGKVAVLDTLVAQMPTANIEQAVKDLASKVKQMKGGIQ
jgi:uncharacterized protein YoxC